MFHWESLIKALTSLLAKSAWKKSACLKTAIHLKLELLEERWLPSRFTAGNIAVLDVGTTNADNDSATVLAFNPTTANQSSPVTTVSINGTSGPASLRFDPGSGKTGFLSDTSDGTLLAFNGYNTTNSSVSQINTITTHGVGTLDSNGNFTLAATYTGTSGNDARGATSPDDASWYIDDKDGLYTSNATSPSLAANILDAKSFGGTVYIGSASAGAVVSTVSSPTATALTSLPGLPADSNLRDFSMISSGSNGSAFDVLYALDETGVTAGAINKYALIGGAWTAEGSYATNFGGDALAAVSNGSGGALLYVTSGKGGTADNSLIRLSDTAAWNAPIGIATANNVTLYTATGSNTLMGVAFAPVAATATTTAVTTPSGATGNPVTLTATVTVASGASAPSAGSVEFFSGSTLLGVATNASVSGNVATFTFSGVLALGACSNIQADYISGGGGYTNSNSVAAAGPTLTVIQPTVTPNTANIASDATTITIAGTDFSTTPANDTASFNLGAAGTVTSATATQLTVALTTGFGSTGDLTAIVMVDGVSSGSAVQVATVTAVTVSFTGSTCTQNFSTLPTGDASIVTNSSGIGPFDLTAASPSGFGASGLSGWYAVNIASGAASERVGQGEPSTTTGALYDFNDGTPGSQALGTISTNSDSSRFGAILENDTGETLTQFSLSYTGEEWWDNSGAGTGLNFSYELGVTTLPDSAGAGTLVSGLGFTAPDSSGSGAYVDGSTTDQVPVSGTVTGISWAPGQALVIFWDKGTGAGSSDGLGIADMKFSAQATPVLNEDAGLTLDRGHIAEITSSMLNVTETGLADSQLVYTLGAPPTCGTLYDNGTALSAGRTFSQADIDNGLLTYSNGGSANAGDAFTFTVSDGAQGSIASTTFSITVNSATAPNVLINEIEANPPGTQDNRYEYVELSGTPDESLNDVYFVTFDGIHTSNPGTADLVVNLSGYSIGSDGLLVIQSSASAGHSIPADTTLVSDPSFFTQSGGFADGTLSFYLFSSSTAFTQGTDYDTNNDGTLDNLPSGCEVLDHVAILDTNSDAAGDIAYGNVVVTESNNTGTADGITRFPGNLAISSAAWYGGEIGLATDTDPSETNYDPNRASANEPSGAVLTPGAGNAIPTTITWTDPADITYGTVLGGSQLDAAASAGGSIVAGTFTYTLADGATPAGGALLSAGQGQTLNVAFTPIGADYSTASAQVVINVEQEAITIAPTSQTQTYGFGSLGTADFTAVSGTIYGSDINGVVLSTDDTTSGSGNYSAGIYDISASAATGAGASNYTISYATDTNGLVIGKRSLTVTGVSGTDRTYNGSASDALSGTAALSSNYISGDDIGLTGTGVGTLASVDAGSEGVTVSGYRIGGADAGDYTFLEPTVADVTIGTEAITITASDQIKIYGSVSLGTSAFGVTSGAVQSGDSISSVTLSAVDINSLGTSGSGNDNAGAWSIAPSAAMGTGGFNTTNYNITYSDGSLTINPLALTVMGISGTGRTYNGSTIDALSGASALSSNYISGDRVALTGTGAGTLTSANAGGEGVTISGYSITGADTGDYNFSEPTVADVTIAPLAVTLSGSRTYDGTTAAASSILTVSNAVGGDTVDVASGSGMLSAKDAGPESIASFGTLALGNNSAGDYTLTGAAGSVTITPLAVTLAGTMAENGTNIAPASVLTVSNTVGGDTVYVASGTATLTGSSAGTQPITSFTGLTLGSNTAGDYTLTGASGSVDITAATVFVEPNDANPLTPSTTAQTLTIMGGGFSAASSHDKVTLRGGTAGAVTDVSAAELKVTVTNLVGGPLDASVSVTGIAGSGSAVQVATVVPVVTSGTTSLAATAGRLTISGSGFSTTVADDVVTFGDGSGRVTGRVTTATATKLTVSGLSGLQGGDLTASVAVNGTSSRTAVQIAKVAPVVTTSRASILATATTITISGHGFDGTTPGNNVLTFSGNGRTITGTVTAATAATLTVTGLSGQVAGALKASVTTDNVGSGGSAVQVATVAPVVTNSTAGLAANSTTMTINGAGFTMGSTVTLTGGTAGAVTFESSTQLKVAVTNLRAGLLTAVIKSSAVSSGTAVPVATVTPVITSSTASLAATATSVTIKGFGFDITNPMRNDVVSFSEVDGTVTGTVTAATLNKLTVALSGELGGILDASVSCNGQTSDTAVEVAKVTPVVTTSTKTSLLANATTLTISGHGFDSTTPSNNVVTFSGNGGTVTGTVTAATATTLTVTGLSGQVAGALKASVATDNVGSGTTAVQVATVIPVVTSTATKSLTASGAGAQLLTINGNGFTTGSTVTLTGATAGTVHVVSANQLTVSVTNLVAGSVTAKVTSSAESSSTVQVATVIPAVTASSVSLTPTAASLTIDGFGFSTTTANDTVTFTNSGGQSFTGSVTAATAAKLTVSLTGLSSDLTAGILKAAVTTAAALRSKSPTSRDFSG